MILMNPNAKIYKFGNFTFGVKEYNLKKGNKELYLRPKTYETLLYLVERHGSVVNKEDIIENVWSGTIVTENTLTQSIKELRDKLEDNSSKPQFIRTVPRVGYKFIAPVREEILNQYVPIETSKSLSYKNLKKTKTLTAMLLISILAMAIFIFFHKYREPEFKFSERNWALITDFDNKTGDEVFGAALRTALEMELSNSKYVNIVPRGRVQDILNLMRAKSGKKIDRDLGREIILRDGNIQILLTGSIYKIGTHYSLSLAIIEPIKNIIIKTFFKDVNNRQDILPAIGQLALSIRKKLGESLKNFPKVPRAFELVTTPSLKALNFYSKGFYYLNLFDFDRAQYFLNQAVLYDSTFAMGYAMLGFAELWHSHLPQGKADFEKAAKLVSNLSERERFFILGSNAMYGDGNYKKGIEYYELLLDVYPDDYWGNENISIAYLDIGDVGQYRKYKRICEKLRPNYFINFSDKGLFSLYYDRNIDKANREFSQALKLNPNYPFEFCYLKEGFVQWIHGDIDSADILFSNFISTKISKLIPMSQISGRWYAAHFFLFEGRFEKAINLLKESVTLAKQKPTSKLLPWARIELALALGEIGQSKQSGLLLKNVSETSVGITRVQALGWLAVYYARTGKLATINNLLSELNHEEGLTPVGILQAPLPGELKKAKIAFTYQVKGEIANAKSDYKKSILYFNKVVELVPSSQLPILTALDPRIRWAALESLAQLQEKMGNWNSALALYYKIVNDKVVNITVPAASGIWVRALLAISTVLEKQGKHAQAVTYYKKYKQLRPKHAANQFK